MILCNRFSGNKYGSNNAMNVEYQIDDVEAKPLVYRISMLNYFIVIHFQW